MCRSPSRQRREEQGHVFIGAKHTGNACEGGGIGSKRNFKKCAGIALDEIKRRELRAYDYDKNRQALNLLARLGTVFQPSGDTDEDGGIYG